MKRAWLGALLGLAAIAGSALGGLTLGGPARAVPAHRARTVVFDCPGQHALVRPRTFVLACADDNAYFDKLAWTSWTSGLASAKGTLVLNDCTPYCAAGHFHSYPAVVVLWGSKAVRPGEHRYTTLTEILTGPRPRYYDAIHHKWVTAPVTQNFPLPTSPATPSPGA